MTHDLLHDPLIQSNRGWHSLPGLLAAMAQGEVTGFPALRPHQRPAWHMFLVQLSVMALDAVGNRILPDDEDEWRAVLSALTPVFPDGEPWHLVVPDRSRPAFMQPPDPGGLKWSEVPTPDALDMLITSRNHDVKREIAQVAAPQDWIFALVSIQTMEGYGGRGNFGIARMNAGSSSRPMLALAPAQSGSADVDPSTWWCRDTLRLRSERRDESGKRLLWQEPWPEGRTLDLAALDPLFIEVCRRLRLVENGGRITAERSSSKATRIAAKDAKGNTGDPWCPIHIAESKALTLNPRDWTYKVVVELMFHEPRIWKVPFLATEHAQEADAPMLLIAEAFSRGNSKTDGFRSRVIPVPKTVVADMLGERSVSMAKGVMDDIAAVDLALRNGLALVSAGGDRERKPGKEHYARSLPARDSLQRQADTLFFPELWRRVAVRDDAGIRPLRYAFLQALAAIARHEFNAALPSIPCASLMRPRAEVRGRAWLENSLARLVRDLKPKEEVHA